MANIILAQNSAQLLRFYTYIHIRVDDGMVFYVGKGKGNRAYSDKGRNKRWCRTANKHGWSSVICAYWYSEFDAFEHEKSLILYYKQLNHPLCNMTDGGDGASGISPSEETRAKLSAALKGRSRPIEVIRKISASNKGKKRTAEQNRKNSEARLGKPLPDSAKQALIVALTGKPRSEETKRKISLANKGKTITPEHRQIISKRNKGIVRTPEFRAKIIAALTGRPVSKETREKISARQIGKTVSQETRDKISKSLTGRQLNDETKAKLIALSNDPVRRARHSAALKGKPWSESRRLAQQNKHK